VNNFILTTKTRKQTINM